jgi:hypothetical protein
MEVHEHYVTRKPLEFTLIFLSIIFLLLIPVYFYTKYIHDSNIKAYTLISESYSEVEYYFSQESDLSADDKKHLFSYKYEGNYVQWQGTLMNCENVGGLYRVRISVESSTFADVIFTVSKDCTNIPQGSIITYKMKLIDWQTPAFIGSDGEILRWE